MVARPAWVQLKRLGEGNQGRAKCVLCTVMGLFSEEKIKQSKMLLMGYGERLGKRPQNKVSVMFVYSSSMSYQMRKILLF